MTKTKSRKFKKYGRRITDGVQLSAEVSPCVFMYQGYPLQITVSLIGGQGEQFAIAYAADRTKTAKTYMDSDVRRLLKAVRVAPCRRCSSPAFDPATIETNRDGLCEVCFIADLNTKWVVEAEAERQELIALDAEMKAQGMRFRLNAWVHADDGDDFEIEYHFKQRPTAEQVTKLLKQRGSSCFHDYSVTAL